VTWTGGGANASDLQASLGTTHGKFGRAVRLSDDALYAVSSAVSLSGDAFVLWQQLPARRLMMSIAPVGHKFGRPMWLKRLSGAKLWALLAPRAGPVIVEWVKPAGDLRRMVMYAARVDRGGRLAGIRRLAAGAIGQQRVSVDRRGDLAVMWSNANGNPPTYLTLCPVARRCRTERVAVNPMFGTIALLAHGTALVAGPVSVFGDGVSVSACPLVGPCRRPQILSRSGLFPEIVVGGASRATVAWEDEASGDGFLSSTVLDPGAKRFSTVTKVRARVGGTLFSLIANDLGAVLAGWQPDLPASSPPSPMITSFAGPDQRLRTITPVPYGQTTQPITATSDPSVGIDQHGNAVMAWSSAGLTSTVVDIAIGHPRNR